MPLLPQACEGQSPEALDEPTVAGFSCGDVLARDAWQGRTILATHGGGDPLSGPGHLHGDLNSFILVHNRERLLVDPGHSCYRGLLHEVEMGTLTHNTCTFELSRDAADGLKLQESLLQPGTMEQSRSERRDIVDGQPGPPPDRGGAAAAGRAARRRDRDRLRGVGALPRAVDEVRAVLGALWQPRVVHRRPRRRGRAVGLPLELAAQQS
ncbi:MAG: heparinase II/III-family protein [Gammaproteobacteria bacterium]|nr:heparinase II/III-family protein [Gammaproteobacteria bacterium]